MAAFQKFLRKGIPETIAGYGCYLWKPHTLSFVRCISPCNTRNDDGTRLSHEEHDDDLSNMAKDLNLSKLDLAERILCHSIKESEVKLGSGVDGSFLDKYICANWSALEGFACDNVGVIPCASCGLVCYCSSECKEENSGKHKLQCQIAAGGKSSTGKLTNTSVKKRQTLGVESDFVWGNMPAYGILPRGVKSDYIPKDLSLCFCACGDLRNVIETVCQLPDKFGGQVTIYMNDHSPIVMARNFLILKLLQTYGPNMVDAVIAVWYSAAMTHAQSIVIDGVVIHTLRSTSGCRVDEEFCADFKAPSSSTLHVSDGFKLWPVLARMCGCKSSVEEVWNSRSEKLKAGLKYGCKTACLHPDHQVAWEEFRRLGLLLPFGAYHAHHSKPNKFLFNSLSGWLPHADANPFSGWDMMSVVDTGPHEGLPDTDIFGSLFFHVRRKLLLFLQKIQTCSIHFKLSCKEASQLSEELAFRKVGLHCVDASNLADLNYCGLTRVLHDWAPLLDRTSLFRPTLVTYFMNWLYNMESPFSHEEITLSKLTWTDVRAAVTLMNTRDSLCAEKLKALLALGNSNGNLSILDYFHDFTPLFEDYLSSLQADTIAMREGVSRRKEHGVVPHRLCVDMEDCNGIPGKRASYDQCYYDCMVADLTFTERFVEWGP